MSKLEARIERLEAQMGARSKRLVIRVSSFCDGAVVGFSTPAGNVMRNPGEAEEALYKRSCEGLTGFVTVREIREGEGKPYVHPYKLEAIQEKSAPPGAERPKPLIESPLVAKPKYPVVEVKEFESEYADRKHWMAY